MIALLFLGALGLAMAYFATQNTGGVPITLASYTFYGVPLYLLVIGSVMLGIAISWLISLFDSVATMFTLHSKDAALREAHAATETLKKENHQLTLEIARLQGERKTPHVADTQEDHSPSLLHRLRHSVS